MPSEFDDIAACKVERPEKRKRRAPKRKKNHRPLMWAVAPAVLVCSLISLIASSSQTVNFSYDEAWVNRSLETRLPYGDGATTVTHARVNLLNGDFQYAVIGKGSNSSYRADVVAQPVYSDCTIVARNPETTIGDRKVEAPTLGDRWSESVPEQVSFMSGVLRTVVSPVDAWTDQSTLNKTRILANGLPVIAMPSADCMAAKSGSVSNVSVVRGAVEVSISQGNMGPVAMTSLLLLVLSGFCVLTLWLNRDFGKP